MNIANFGKGALLSGYDIRDYWYSPKDKGAFDWETGYDVEKEMGHKLSTKNQGPSGSCGGQAWAYYGEVLEWFGMKEEEEQSARWIYSHTRIAPAGSSGRDNSDFVIKKGWAQEKYAVSYKNGKPPSEEFMATIPVLSAEGNEEMEISRALSYVSVVSNIEVMAQAIQDNHGIVIVLNGSDNGTWLSEFPKPPIVKEWGHFLYTGKVRLYKGEKQIGFKNSWGSSVGKQGWQWIGEDYFKSGHVREGWALVWDYKAPLHKQLLIQTVAILMKLVDLYKQLIATKK